jgi:hypothetical protein
MFLGYYRYAAAHKLSQHFAIVETNAVPASLHILELYVF